MSKMIDNVNNSSENQSKVQFFKHFDWFHKFHQSQRIKFVDACHFKEFYPGQKIISEGTNDLKIYIIVSGTCNIECQNVTKQFKDL